VKALVNGHSTDGNYLAVSPHWASNKGAVTCASGTTGVTGTLSSSNSLVGSKTGTVDVDFDAGGDLLGYRLENSPPAYYDSLGHSAITELSNGNYVIASSWHDSGGLAAGAVTFRKGDCSSTNGVITSSNSLVGVSVGANQPSLSVQNGSTLVTALKSNGNYVVTAWITPDGATTAVGSATWGSGTSGVSGAIDSTNSLLWNTTNGLEGAKVLALSNGNYVLSSPSYQVGASIVGAVTWASGTAGVTGRISSTNSVIGSTTTPLTMLDTEQWLSAAFALSNGNFFVPGGDPFAIIMGGSYMNAGSMP
jgi:hypothetical protein